MLGSRVPKPVASYKTILNPFDLSTWGFMLLAIGAQFVLLLLAQNAWSKFTGRDNPEDYVYEGWQVPRSG